MVIPILGSQGCHVALKKTKRNQTLEVSPALLYQVAWVGYVGNWLLCGLHNRPVDACVQRGLVHCLGD